ncbi:MAG: vWA domain-containing protein [Chloroflexota bacterium]
MSNNDIKTVFDKARWVEQHPVPGHKAAIKRLEQMLDGDPAHARIPVKAVLVLDVSGSMDGEPIESLKSATEDFIWHLHNEKENGDSDSLGLVKFSNRADYLWGEGNQVQPLKMYEDQEAAENTVETLTSDGTTNIGAGLSLAKQMLDGQTGNRAIVLISDGINDSDATPIPSSVIEDLKKMGAPVYTVAVGNNADQAMLKDIAIEDERFHHADNAEAIDEIFHEIMDQTNITRMLYNHLSHVAPGQLTESEFVVIPQDATRLTISVTWADPDLHWVYRKTPNSDQELAIDVIDENGSLIDQSLFKVRTGKDNCVVMDLKLSDYGSKGVKVQATTKSVNGTSTTPVPITLAISADITQVRLLASQSAALVPKGTPFYCCVAMRNEWNKKVMPLQDLSVTLLTPSLHPETMESHYHDKLKAIQDEAEKKGQSISRSSAMMTLNRQLRKEQGQLGYQVTPLTDLKQFEENRYIVMVPTEALGIHRVKFAGKYTDEYGHPHTLTRLVTAYVYDPNSSI